MTLGVSFVAIFIGAFVLVALLALSRPRPAPPPLEDPGRLSWLCVGAFLFALLAALTVLAALLTGESVAYRDLMGLHAGDIAGLKKASEGLRLGALLPAFGALGLAIAGRGAVRESQGALRGRALYRAALLVALCVGLLAWSGLSAAGFTVARPAAP